MYIVSLLLCVAYGYQTPCTTARWLLSMPLLIIVIYNNPLKSCINRCSHTAWVDVTCRRNCDVIVVCVCPVPMFVYVVVYISDDSKHQQQEPTEQVAEQVADLSAIVEEPNAAADDSLAAADTTGEITMDSVRIHLE